MHCPSLANALHPPTYPPLITTIEEHPLTNCENASLALKHERVKRCQCKLLVRSKLVNESYLRVYV